MKARRYALLLAVTLTFGSVAAMATDYTFTGNTSNTWDNGSNWYPPDGPPDAGDKATIPDGKTCQVIDANQAAEIIDVQSGGTLGIVGRTLTLGSTTEDTTSTTSGTIYFQKSGDRDAVLKVAKWVDLNGSGTLTAKADDGREGVIEWYAPGDRLALGAGMTLTGTFQINSGLKLRFNSENDFAKVLIDDDDDMVTLGEAVDAPPGKRISGAGKFDVRAGVLKIRCVGFNSTTPKWVISGTGQIRLTDVAEPHESIFTNLTVAITITGGDLVVDDDLGTTGDLVFSGGEIWVGSHNVAEFR
ncbi:MAG: hypothetical protein KKB50_00675 [Planctomycetes bacterium]|nr:hypothetical protein [Planctomycetota bacterium]